ncbi:unnamed protein product [Ectocarpus sp. 12 AP-2014]
MHPGYKSFMYSKATAVEIKAREKTWCSVLCMLTHLHSTLRPTGRCRCLCIPHLVTDKEKSLSANLRQNHLRRGGGGALTSFHVIQVLMQHAGVVEVPAC